MKYTVGFIAVLLGLVFTLVQTSDAQSREDVVLSFNEGFELVQAGEDLAAIEKFEETLELAEAVGDEAEDIRNRVRGLIPDLYFRHAAGLFRAGNVDDAIEAFRETITYAERYDNDNIKARAEGNLPRLYLSKGNRLYRDEDFDGAMEAYDNALELNPNYPQAIYQKGLVFRQKQELDNALEQFDRAIDMSLNSGDNEMVNRASASARDYLIFVGANMIEDENYSGALGLLERALTYDNQSAEAHYRLAETHNHLENWDQAVSHGTQAIELETGGRADQAKIWFELGVAYKNQANESQACEAFTNAAFGPFQAAAEHELEHELNCATATR